jgi:hypothetical protein
MKNDGNEVAQAGSPGSSRAWTVLGAAGIGLAVALARDAGWAMHAAQGTTFFKQITGYLMLVTMGVLMSHGLLRRSSFAYRVQFPLESIHEWLGLACYLVLLAHMGRHPQGLTAWLFYAFSSALITGSLRQLTRMQSSPWLAKGLLAAHLLFSISAFAAALMHVYFVYQYAS